MCYSTRFMLALTLLLPVAASAEHYAYEGTITFLALSGKDCGEIKLGDSRPYKLTADIQNAHIVGYSQTQDGFSGQIVGADATRLKVTYPDPQQAEGHRIALSGLGKTTLTGELHEKALRPDEAGCNWLRGKIVAQRIASGQDAKAKQQEFALAFQSDQQEYVARQRDPQAFTRLEQLASELNFAKANSNTKMAVELRQAMRPLAEKCYGKPSRYLADLLVNQADDLETLNRDQDALELYPQAVAMSEASYGLDHLKVATALGNFGYQLNKMGRYHEVMPLYQRAIAIKQKVFGFEHSSTAGSLSNLAQLYETLGKYDQALPLYQRSLAIREKVLGPEHALTATSLNNLANLYETLGRYTLALPLYLRSLAIDEKVLGADHPGVATDLNNLAMLHQTLGQYDQALPLYQRALVIREKVLGPEHADTATSLNNLAYLYQPLGQYAQALPLYQRALAIREKALGPEHADTAGSLHNLAELYRTLGQYAQALPLYQRALATFEKSLGPEHASTAISLSGLAALYQNLGQYDQALPLYQRVLAIKEKAFGPEHGSVATSLSNLALLYNFLGRYDLALPLHQRALAIREKVLGPEHADTAGSLNNLAALYDTLGQYDRALPLYQRALAIREKVLGSEHADTAQSLNNLAYLYKSIGQYNQVLPLYQRALVIREKALGPEHDYTATSMNNLAFFHGYQQHSVEALHWFKRGQTVTDHIIQNTFSILTEQQKLKFVKMKEGELHGMLSLIHRQLASDPAAIRAGLDLVLSRKGIVFDAQARQQDAIARSLDPETKKLWDALSNQRGELAKLMQSKPEKLSSEAYQKRIADYQAAITELESQLASKSALVAQELKQRTVTSQEVANTLGKSGVLAEFVKIQDYDWEHGKWSDTWRYLAFILHGDGKIQLVDLGEAGALESTVQAALKPIGLVGSSNDQQQDATRSLYQTLWQPIAAAVGDANQIVFSPDGLLNLVPFAAMQDADGHYLIESRQISYVTSGRDLTKGDLGIKPETELYLAANPKFDLAVQASPTPANEELTRGAVRSAGFGLHFSPLPGTAQEAEQVPSYLTGKHTVLTGKEATEESVLNIRRPRVMHLSTHGFFLADQAAITQGTRGASRIDSDQPQIHHSDSASSLPPGYENPLVRSGLAFAGANHAGDAKGGRDGLLTALEVSGMDLHGTDLVTLSACETGRGEVKSGEGVFGLRRAFALAGTAHLMMSLWPVSDDVTAQQMQSFYRLYGKKTAPAAALRQAQLATIAELRSKKGQAEPALWAPFIVQGW